MDILNIIKNTFIYNNNFLIKFILFIPTLYLYFNNDIILFGQDETNQIESAFRFLYTHQFTYTGNIKGLITENSFIFQNAWPFGYSLLIYIFLLFSNNIFLVIKIIKILLIFINIYCWSKIAKHFISCISILFYYDLIIILLTIIFSISTTDLISTIFTGIISYLILISKSRYKDFFVGFSLSIAFIFKYSIIFILPSLIIYYFFIYKKNIKIFFTKSLILLFSFLPLFSFIYLFNKFNASGNFYVFKSLDLLKIKNFIYPNWLTDITTSIVQAFSFDKILSYISISDVSIVYFNIFIILFIIILFIRNINSNLNLILLIFSFFISNILFLKTIQSFFFEHTYIFRPIIIYRYFWPIIPLSYIILFKSLSDFKILKNEYLKTIFSLSIFVFIFIDSAKKNSTTLFIQKNRLEVMNFLKSRNLLSNSTNTIVFAEKAQWSLFTPKGKYNIYQVSGEKNDIDFDYIKKNTTIIYINDRSFYGTYNEYNQPNEDLINKLSNHFVINKHITIHWKLF
jgi:hypothetical protein